MGGVWERLIGVCKRTLKKVLGNAFITIDELYTIITEVEARVNNRPLTYVSSEGFDKPLTPSQLICGRDIETLPALVDEEDKLETYEFDPTAISRRHRKLLKLINNAWDKWSQEYILMLRDRDKKAIPGNKTGEKVPMVGDVVIMLAEHKSAPLQLGRII